VEIKKSAKNMVKKVLTPVVLNNLKGLSKAVSSYYPEYVLGNGKVKGLKQVTIEVTFRCNCRCKMCPLYGVQTKGGGELLKSLKEQSELTIDEFRKLFSDLKDIGTQKVNLTGGEVFLRKDILEIIKLARENRLDVSMTSNGGLITEEIAKKVVEYGVDDITISLDGPKEVHEDIRKAKIFDRIMDAVDWIEQEKKLQKKSRPSIDFLCTVSGLNQNHLSDLVAIAKGKNVPLTIDPIIFTSEDVWEESKEVLQNDFVKNESFVMPKEIGEVNTDALESELEVVFSQAKELDQFVYVSVVGGNTRKRFFNDPAYSLIDKCFSPWYSCRIDPNGNVYPCSLSINVGNVRQQSIKEIVNGDKFVDFRRKLKKNKLLPFCNKCCILYSHNLFWNYLPKL